MKIAALLTGRGNNTLQDKNVMPVLGRPLLYYPCMAAKKSNYVETYWVSSDCKKILKAASDLMFKEIKRPRELALPTAQHIEAIDHALLSMRNARYEPDILVVMLANSVTIKAEWIDACIQLLIKDKNATSVVPVCREMDHHPYRCKKISDEGYLEPFFDFSNKTISTNRQDLVPAYFLSHNFWVLKVNQIDRKVGQKPWVFMGDKIKHFEIEEAFDVHSTDDITKSEKWLIKNNIL